MSGGERWLKQTWSQGHNPQGQGLGLQGQGLGLGLQGQGQVLDLAFKAKDLASLFTTD